MGGGGGGDVGCIEVGKSDMCTVNYGHFTYLLLHGGGRKVVGVRVVEVVDIVCIVVGTLTEQPLVFTHAAITLFIIYTYNYTLNNITRALTLLQS